MYYDLSGYSPSIQQSGSSWETPVTSGAIGWIVVEPRAATAFPMDRAPGIRGEPRTGGVDGLNSGSAKCKLLYLACFHHDWRGREHDVLSTGNFRMYLSRSTCNGGSLMPMESPCRRYWQPNSHGRETETGSTHRIRLIGGLVLIGLVLLLSVALAPRRSRTAVIGAPIRADDYTFINFDP